MGIEFGQNSLDAKMFVPEALQRYALLEGLDTCRAAGRLEGERAWSTQGTATAKPAKWWQWIPV